MKKYWLAIIALAALQMIWTGSHARTAQASGEAFTCGSVSDRQADTQGYLVQNCNPDKSFSVTATTSGGGSVLVCCASK